MKNKKKENDYKLYSFIRPVATFLIKLLYRPKFINANYLPVDKTIILAGNHKHAFDPILVVASTKKQLHFVAKKELFSTPLKPLLKALRVIPVDRSIRDKNATDSMQDNLKAGKSLCIFPEGKRNRTSELLLPFKYGAVSLAQKTNSLIVPFAIIGKYRLFRKGLIVKYGKPIDVTSMEISAANEYLMESIGTILKDN